jgi:hypothetical protein
VNGVKNNGEKNVVNAKQEAQAAHAVLHGNIARCGLSANPFPLAKDNWPGVLGLLSEFHFGTILVSRRVSTTLRQSAKEFSEYSFLENPMRRVC